MMNLYTEGKTEQQCCHELSKFGDTIGVHHQSWEYWNFTTSDKQTWPRAAPSSMIRVAELYYENIGRKNPSSRYIEVKRQAKIDRRIRGLQKGRAWKSGKVIKKHVSQKPIGNRSKPKPSNKFLCSICSKKHPHKNNITFMCGHEMHKKCYAENQKKCGCGEREIYEEWSTLRDRPSVFKFLMTKMKVKDLAILALKYLY